MKAQVGVLYNSERKGMAESLVTSPISRNTQGLWEFFHYRKVERMEAKMLTCICKGDDCNLNPGSWTVTRLCLSSTWQGGEELACIILPTRRTSSGWNQIWTRYVKVFYWTCDLNAMYKVLSHMIWEMQQGTRNIFSLQRVSWKMGKEAEKTLKQDRMWSVMRAVR